MYDFMCYATDSGDISSDGYGVGSETEASRHIRA